MTRVLRAIRFGGVVLLVCWVAIALGSFCGYAQSGKSGSPGAGNGLRANGAPVTKEVQDTPPDKGAVAGGDITAQANLAIGAAQAAVSSVQTIVAALAIFLATISIVSGGSLLALRAKINSFERRYATASGLESLRTDTNARTAELRSETEAVIGRSRSDWLAALEAEGARTATSIEALRSELAGIAESLRSAAASGMENFRGQITALEQEVRARVRTVEGDVQARLSELVDEQHRVAELGEVLLDLTRIAGETDAASRLIALQHLAQRVHPACISAFIGILGADGDERLRIEAAYGLGRFAEKPDLGASFGRIVECFERVLSDGGTPARLAAEVIRSAHRFGPEADRLQPLLQRWG